MKFDRRLARVERILGEAGVCPECKGEGGGPWIMAKQWDEPDPVWPGCPGCGKRRPGEARLIVIDDREMPALERP